jgi:hypothetical protein
MSRIRPPENIEIASLKRKQATLFEPMRPGVGTPWEDRGTHGTVGAFFKTCFASMFSPGKLTTSIRRPETTSDARGFLFGVCGLWAISGLMHYVYFVWRETKDPLFNEINSPQVYVLGLITAGLCGGGTFLLFRLYTAIYGKLASQEKGSTALPDVLIYNVSAYALGPSLLALIPLAGPFLALVWIFASMVGIGSSRLQLKLPAAIIDSLISLAAVVAIVVAVYFGVERGLNDHVVGYSAVDMRDPKAPVSASGLPGK